jgi:hypothetical protein
VEFADTTLAQQPLIRLEQLQASVRNCRSRRSPASTNSTDGSEWGVPGLAGQDRLLGGVRHKGLVGEDGAARCGPSSRPALSRCRIEGARAARGARTESPVGCAAPSAVGAGRGDACGRGIRADRGLGRHLHGSARATRMASALADGLGSAGIWPRHSVPSGAKGPRRLEKPPKASEGRFKHCSAVRRKITARPNDLPHPEEPALRLRHAGRLVTSRRQPWTQPRSAGQRADSSLPGR